MSQEQLSEAMREFEKFAEKLQTNHQNRAKLMTQQNENDGVLKELDACEADSVIYKVIGPVLVRQERDDAVSTVKKRLEYVAGELERCDKMEAEIRTQLQEAAQKVENLQKRMLDRQRQQKGRI